MTQVAESSPILVRGARIWPLSVPAYHVLGEAGLIPERTELLYGFVYTKMPKSPFHSALVMRLFRLLQGLLPNGLLLRTEQPISHGDSEPEPDLSVVTGPEERYWKEHPSTAELVIEVCVTSHEYDRSKLRAYALAGVKECWLVLGPEKQVEIHREPHDGVFSKHTVHGPGGQIASVAIPAISLQLDAIFEK
jgi:Uma2 family endonuclease